MRLFTSIDVPPEFHETLKQLQGNFPDLKPVSEFHLTLRFLGDDVPDDKLPTIAQALSTVRFRPFELTMESVEVFGQAEGLRLVWVACQETPELVALVKQINEKMTAIRLPTDKPFKAHITLGRYKNIPEFMPKKTRFTPESFTVREFYLVKSTPNSAGSAYQRLKSYMCQG